MGDDGGFQRNRRRAGERDRQRRCSGEPLDVLNSGALIKVAKQAGRAAGTIVAQNVLDAWSRLWAASRKSAVWIANQEAEKQLPALTIP
jgi:HK97 family phage major capsid protein